MAQAQKPLAEEYRKDVELGRDTRNITDFLAHMERNGYRLGETRNDSVSGNVTYNLYRGDNLVGVVVNGTKETRNEFNPKLNQTEARIYFGSFDEQATKAAETFKPPKRQ